LRRAVLAMIMVRSVKRPRSDHNQLDIKWGINST
jgi:hypothetical protein